MDQCESSLCLTQIHPNFLWICVVIIIALTNVATLYNDIHGKAQQCHYYAKQCEENPIISKSANKRVPQETETFYKSGNRMTNNSDFELANFISI